MQTKNSISKTVLALVLVATLMVGTLSVAQAQGGPPPMFGDLGDAHPPAGAPNQAHVARFRFATVNLGALFTPDGRQLGKSRLPEVSLNLFPNVAYTGVVKRAWSDSWGSYWTGTLKGVENGYFYLTVVENAFMAHVGSPQGIYEVSLTSSGTYYQVIQIDQSKFTDHDEAWTYEPSGQIIPEGSLGDTADTAARIDIMVAYTDDARAAAGGTPAIKATILTALNETNTSYANSGVTTRLRLVHVQEYSYTETGDLNTDLTRFRNTTDAYFTSIHSLRNTYGADMVGLIVENGGAYCGLASTIMATAATAFQVTDRSCATGYYSFGHEFGHLQGARHDTYVDTNNTPYSYGHGYVHTGSTDYNRWRTIMAYNNKCADLGYNCTRIQWWSNPAKTYHAAATGTASTKNYLVLNNTDYTVANFRTQKIANNFNSSFNGSSAGWSAVKGTWSIYNSVNYRSAGVASKVASAKHTGTYGDLTYQVRMKRTGTCTSCANRIIIRGKPASLDALYQWKPSYIFQYTNNGNFSVFEISSTGTEIALKGWTASASIVKNGWNTLKVIAVGKSLKFYINGTLVWSGNDPTLKTGQVGFGFYRDANTGTLYVDWAKLSTTATADFNPYEEVAPGETIPGGDSTHSP
ncbi:MAG: DUF1080 domain-containing protein [Anaerolineaceae bacterium]|nr:MAG: DUF1080 domain-containing protein [Anaerolineaceae bacterium]